MFDGTGEVEEWEVGCGGESIAVESVWEERGGCKRGAQSRVGERSMVRCALSGFECDQ